MLVVYDKHLINKFSTIMCTITVNFVGFSIIRVSQGSVATYVRYGGMSTYSKFPAESVSERIFNIGYDLTKLLPKFGGMFFWNTVYISTSKSPVSQAKRYFLRRQEHLYELLTKQLFIC